MRTGVGRVTIHDVMDGINGRYTEDQFSYAGDPLDEDVWHFPAQSLDKFKRARVIDELGQPIVDGSTDASGWVYTQIAPIKDVDYGDGGNGDTIYEVYQYSVNGIDAWEDDFTDAHKYRRTAVVINGAQSEWSAAARISGEDGTSISSVTNYYLATNSSTGVTHSTSGWTTTIQNPSASKKYLWNYEAITFSSGHVTRTDPTILGNYASDGDNGDNGVGIASIVEYYNIHTSGTAAPTDTWTTTPQATTSAVPYLWNYEVVTYTDASTHTTSKRVIGTHGADGGNGLQTNVLTLYQVKEEKHNWTVGELVQTDETYLIINQTYAGYDAQIGINGWMLDVPAVLNRGEALYQIRIGVLSEAGQLDVVVPADDWAAPVQVSAAGVAGEPGNHGSGSWIIQLPDVADIPSSDSGKDTHLESLANRPAQAGDMITYISDGSVAEADAFTKQYLRDTTSWDQFAFRVDGSAVIEGTLSAQALKSGTAITDILYLTNANSKAELTLSGSGDWTDSGGNTYTSDYRQWVGSINPNTAPYKVDKTGNVYMSKLTAESAVVKGHVEASSGSFKGHIEANSGYFKGTIYVENLEGDVNELYVKSIPRNPDNTAKSLSLYSITIPSRDWDRTVVLPGVSLSLTDGTIKCLRNGSVIKSYIFSSGLGYSMTSQIAINIGAGSADTHLEVIAVGDVYAPVVWAEQDAMITTFKS